MAQISSKQLMKELNAENDYDSAGQTYESIIWKDKPKFTKEQFTAKYDELIQNNPIPDARSNP
jgi:hypothetical protein